jgi:MFS family permease
VLLPVFARRITEPDRFLAASGDHVLPVIGAVGRTFRMRLLVVLALTFALAVITGPANSFLFLYAQNVLGLSGAVTGAMVIGAGVAGLSGLLLGRWLADHVGRRATGAATMVLVGTFGVLTYSGSRSSVVIGYVAGIMAVSALAPAAGALSNELFPTSVRASVAGWQVAAAVLGAVVGLLVFGSVADVADRFGTAALLTFVPAAAAAVLFLLLPETRGRELEDLWPGRA